MHSHDSPVGSGKDNPNGSSLIAPKNIRKMFGVPVENLLWISGTLLVFILTLPFNLIAAGLAVAAGIIFAPSGCRFLRTRWDAQYAAELANVSRKKELCFRDCLGVLVVMMFVVSPLSSVFMRANQNLTPFNLHIERARKLALSNKLQKALEETNLAMEFDRNSGPAFLLRGCIFDGLGQYDKALADVDKAVELEPRVAQNYVMRSEVQSALGKFQSALADSSKAIELEPSAAAAYRLRAKALFKLHQYDQCLAACEKALKLDPQNPINGQISLLKKIASAGANNHLKRFRLGEQGQLMEIKESAPAPIPRGAKVLSGSQ